jgi:hypothetical protein
MLVPTFTLIGEAEARIVKDNTLRSKSQHLNFTLCHYVPSISTREKLSLFMLVLQLTALAEQVHNSWAAKEPEDYTFYDLVALQQILCGFNRTTIERIHPSAYRQYLFSIKESQDFKFSTFIEWHDNSANFLLWVYYYDMSSGAQHVSNQQFSFYDVHVL